MSKKYSKKELKKIQNYDNYMKIFIEASNKLEHALKWRDLNNNTLGLPEARWFVKHCPNKNIKNFNEFVEWCGFTPRYYMSKNKAIELINKKQQELNRPLLESDFDNPKENDIGNSVINRFWGNLNNMKKELGLEIVQEDMIHKQRELDELKKDIIYLCDYIYKTENRKTIILNDITTNKKCLSAGTYSKVFKKNGFTLRQYIESLGFVLQDAGNGLNYTFNDGEKVLSQYEHYFSNILKNKYHLIFNKDYFRDIRYKDFISNYNNLMNCDYVIYYNNRTIYVEIAGILAKKENYWFDDIPITTSKSKEKYRQKLILKEQMLKENNKEYYIFLPSQVAEENIDKIFN